LLDQPVALVLPASCGPCKADGKGGTVPQLHRLQAGEKILLEGQRHTLAGQQNLSGG